MLPGIDASGLSVVEWRASSRWVARPFVPGGCSSCRVMVGAWPLPLGAVLDVHLEPQAMGPVPGNAQTAGPLPLGSWLKLDLGAPPRMGAQPISVPRALVQGAPGRPKLSGFTPHPGQHLPHSPYRRVRLLSVFFLGRRYTPM